jgi:hypothetical protein
LKALLSFEQALLAPANFRHVPLGVSFTNDRLNHAYRVVLALRRIASDLLDLEGDMREYYQALFIHTLNIMRLRHISAEKKEHSLLSASLICQRLEDWPEWESSPAGMSSSKLTSALSQSDKSAEISEAESSALDHAAESQRHWRSRLVGAGAFFLLGTLIVVLLWWAMRYFTPDWWEHVAVLSYLSVFAIIVFALLGLVKGPAAISALLEIVSNLSGRTKHPQSDKLGSDK